LNIEACCKKYRAVPAASFYSLFSNARFLLPTDLPYRQDPEESYISKSAKSKQLPSWFSPICEQFLRIGTADFDSGLQCIYPRHPWGIFSHTISTLAGTFGLRRKNVLLGNDLPSRPTESHSNRNLNPVSLVKLDKKPFRYLF
jgi:hypothetical protein